MITKLHWNLLLFVTFLLLFCDLYPVAVSAATGYF